MKVIRGPQRRIKRTRSTKQRKRNKAFQTCSNYWTKHFSNDLYELWLSFAVPPETSFNAFLRINIHRVYNDLSILPVPPGVV